MLINVWKALASFQMSLFLIILAGFIFTPPIYSQSWSDTRLMTTMGNNLYTIETDGTFYVTNLTTGVKTQGIQGFAANFQDHQVLFTSGTTIYTITSNGDLYESINNTIRKIALGTWRNTRLVATDLNYFYTIETDGSLYKTHFNSKVKTRIGTNTWPGAKLLYVQAGSIVIIGYPQIYGVNPSTGAMAGAGPANLLSGTRLGANVGNDFYSIESSGLYRTSVTATQPPQLNKTRVVAAWESSKFLFSVGNELWAIVDEQYGGRLYRIAHLTDGKYTKRFPPASPTPNPNSFAPTPGGNIALGKLATQSSNIGSPWAATEGVASLAVDGNTNGNWFGKSVTHTANGKTKDPWWQVDLGADFNVSKIEIWNRTDCCSKELSNYAVWTKSAAGGWEEFHPGLETYVPGETYPRTFTGSKQARFVRVQMYGPNAVLMLAEVAVYGSPVSSGGGSNVGTTAAEQALWDTVKQINSKAGYEQYLIKYPQGTYVESARISIAAITGQSATPTPQQGGDSEDERFWALVKEAGVAKGYQEYLNRFTFGKHRDEATLMLNLKSGASGSPTPPQGNDSTDRAKEQALWETVKGINTLDGYLDFLKRYPEGVYAESARILMKSATSATPAATPTPAPTPAISDDERTWNLIAGSLDVGDYEAYLNAFPNGKFKGEANVKIARLKPAKKDPPAAKERECVVNRLVNLRDDYNKGKILGTLAKGRTVIFIEEQASSIRVGESRSGRLISLGWVFYQYLDCEP